MTWCSSCRPSCRCWSCCRSAWQQSHPQRRLQQQQQRRRRRQLCWLRQRSCRHLTTKACRHLMLARCVLHTPPPFLLSAPASSLISAALFVLPAPVNRHMWVTVYVGTPALCRRRRLQCGYAWSGSDSGDDGDPLGLLGVAFEGAVSPGFSDCEAEHVEQARWVPKGAALPANTPACTACCTAGLLVAVHGAPC